MESMQLSIQGYDLAALLKCNTTGITSMIINFQGSDVINKSCENCKAESIVD